MVLRFSGPSCPRGNKPQYFWDWKWNPWGNWKSVNTSHAQQQDLIKNWRAKRQKRSHAGAQSPQMEKAANGFLGDKKNEMKRAKPKRQIINFMLQPSEEKRSSSLSCWRVGRSGSIYKWRTLFLYGVYAAWRPEKLLKVYGASYLDGPVAAGTLEQSKWDSLREICRGVAIKIMSCRNPLKNVRNKY